MKRVLICLLISISFCTADDWPQGSGPSADFTSPGTALSDWSVVQSRNLLWRKTLLETGQSTVVVHGGKAFFTTMEPVDADSELGANIEVWCVDADSGDTICKVATNECCNTGKKPHHNLLSLNVLIKSGCILNKSKRRNFRYESEWSNSQLSGVITD